MHPVSWKRLLFRRTVIPVPELLEAAEKYFRKVSRGVAASVVFSIETVSESVDRRCKSIAFFVGEFD